MTTFSPAKPDEDLALDVDLDATSPCEALIEDVDPCPRPGEWRVTWDCGCIEMYCVPHYEELMYLCKLLRKHNSYPTCIVHPGPAHVVSAVHV